MILGSDEYRKPSRGSEQDKKEAVESLIRGCQGQNAVGILWFIHKMTCFIYEIPRLIYSHKNHKLTSAVYS